MTLASGTKLGSYEILAPIGAGGMGEVYRAKDTRVDRAVALKVLPEEFFEDSERRGRFEREAKLLASLNHPGIATLYSFEEISGRHVLSMELVEGEDLAAKILSGPLSLEESLSFARQMAEALEAAHEKGIIHRDLKPANVKVTPDGRVKLLDFGLAKIFEGDAGPGSQPAVTRSPTLTARATAAGVILGTAAYMSPEQARGKPLDKRTDVWAFGAVLFEMLTGKRAFEGETVSDTLAAVLMKEPDWSALPPGTPEKVREILRKCLRRDAKVRLRDIGDARLDLEDLAASAGASGQSPFEEIPSLPGPTVGRGGMTMSTRGSRKSLYLSWALAAAFAAAAVVFGVLALRSRAPRAAPVARFSLTLPAGQNLSGLIRRAVAISPDGTRIAYTASDSIFIRDLDDAEPRRLLTGGATDLTFSPDGEWLAFTGRASLSKLRVRGGSPEPLVANAGTVGASWTDDGAVIFADSKGLYRVPAAGGAPQTLFASTPPVYFSWPQVLPGGRFLLYTEAVNGLATQAVTVVRALDGSDRRVVLENSFGALYADTGHLVFARVGGLMAVPFDLPERRATGAPVTLPESARFSPGTGAAQFAFSATGTLVHVSAGDDQDVTQLVWVDRGGKPVPASPNLRVFSDVRLSKDGRRVAMHLLEEGNDVWVSDLSRGTMTRLSFEPTEDETPVWSPDERQIAWAATRTGEKRGVYRRAADGATAEELVATSEEHSHVMDWSPDGQALVVELQGGATGHDLMLLDLTTRKFRPLIQTRFNDRFGRFSPDGKWFAYSSDESGRDEVYVQPFPSLDARVQVSSEGGTQPIWSRDGRELFYRDAKSAMAAAVTSRAPIAFARPRALFADPFEQPQRGSHVSWDVAPDGRFLMIAAPERRTARPSEIRVVLNWFEELRRLAPRSKP